MVGNCLRNVFVHVQVWFAREGWRRQGFLVAKEFNDQSLRCGDVVTVLGEAAFGPALGELRHRRSMGDWIGAGKWISME